MPRPQGLRPSPAAKLVSMAQPFVLRTFGSITRRLHRPHELSAIRDSKTAASRISRCLQSLCHRFSKPRHRVSAHDSRLRGPGFRRKFRRISLQFRSNEKSVQRLRNQRQHPEGSYRRMPSKILPMDFKWIYINFPWIPGW